MIRSIYFTFGLFLALWGLSLVFVDTIVIRKERDWVTTKPAVKQYFQTNNKNQRYIELPEWISFGLISFGTVTMLYSVALPNNADQKKK